MGTLGGMDGPGTETLGGRVVLVLGLFKGPAAQAHTNSRPTSTHPSVHRYPPYRDGRTEQARAPPSRPCTCPSWSPRRWAQDARLLSRSAARSRARLHPHRRAACPLLPRRREQRRSHPPDRRPPAEVPAGKPCLKSRGPTAGRQGHTSACARFRLVEVPPHTPPRQSRKRGLECHLPVVSRWQA